MKKKVENFIRHVREMQEKDKFDLSSAEDLSIAVMNLVSIEEHLYFTAIKTGKQKYLEMLNSAREIRKELMKKLVVKPEGEEWCISKHLLAASMRLIEAGNKYLKENKKGGAWKLFENAFELYSMFFALNLKTNRIIAGGKLNIDDLKQFSNEKYDESRRFSLKGKFSEMIKKIINCCKE